MSYRGTKYTSYKSYLLSPEWRKTKEKVTSKFRLFGKTKEWCVFCHTKQQINYHHLTYNRVGHRNEWRDLKIVCKPHHTACHYLVWIIKIPNNTFWIRLRYYDLRIHYKTKAILLYIVRWFISSYSIPKNR